MIPIYFGDRRLAAGSVDPFSYCTYTIRAKAQTALRHLGETPSDLPATVFRTIPDAGDDLGPYVAVVLKEPKADGLKKVKKGQSPLQVLRLAGGPDRVANGRTIAWEYHIDGESAHSLHVVWTQENPPTVAEVKKMATPAWKSDTYEP